MHGVRARFGGAAFILKTSSRKSGCSSWERNYEDGSLNLDENGVVEVLAEVG